MNRMTLDRAKPGSGHGSWRRITGLISLILLMVLSLGACGASNWERLRASGTLSNGEVILGEFAADPSDSAQPSMPNDGLNPSPGDAPQKEGTGASPSATAAGVSPPPIAQPESSAEMQSTPLPGAPATPEPKPAFVDAGIIVRSENILSTNEKEVLLNELERELNGLFGAIDQVSTEPQSGQAE